MTNGCQAKLRSRNLIDFHLLTSLLSHTQIILLSHHLPSLLPSVGLAVLRMSFSIYKTPNSLSLKSPAQAFCSLCEVLLDPSHLSIDGNFMTVPFVHYYNVVYIPLTLTVHRTNYPVLFLLHVSTLCWAGDHAYSTNTIRLLNRYIF